MGKMIFRGIERKVTLEDEELILEDTALGRVRRIPLTSITKVKYLRSNISYHGFIAICTDDGIGNNIDSIKEAKNNKNSVLFHHMNKKEAEHFIEELIRALKIEKFSNDEALLESVQLSDKDYVAKRRNNMFLVGSLIFFLCCMTIALGMWNSHDRRAEENRLMNSITLEQYNSVKSDMTYEDVVKIFNNIQGELLSESETQGMKMQMVTWNGTGDALSNANVTFVNGKVYAKAQWGLE